MRLFLSLSAAALLAAACEQPASAPAATTPAASGPAGAKIAFVNTDSIISGYTYLRDQYEILGKRQQDAAADFERRTRKFQEQVQGFSRRAQGGNMTPKAIENEQRVLAQREQELAGEQQRLAGEFQQEELRLQNELTTVLKREVETIRAAEGYDYVLTYGGGSNVISANPAFEITSSVLAAMNGASTTPAADTTAAALN